MFSNKPLVDCLFRPASIALVGASADPAKHSALLQKHLVAHGYRGELFPINPSHESVLGVRAYRSVGDVPHPVDHAFIMLPTHRVQAAVEDCVSAGVQCVTIMSNGFSEAGDEGRARQAKMLETLRGTGTRLLGPNALGVVDLHEQVALSANEVLSLPTLMVGDVGLISQSGSMLGAILSRGQARNIGFSKLVSVGNEADISVAELIEMLVDDTHTSVILLFIETIRYPERIRRAVYRAHQAGKPVLAYRLGRSSAGQELAVSHTGALAGNGRAVGAFLADVGIAELLNFDSLLDAPLLFAGRRPASGVEGDKKFKLGVMTTTGGGGALVVDNLGERGIAPVGPSTQMRTALAKEGIAISDAPLVDLTLAGTNQHTYGAVLREFLADDGVDGLVCVVGSSSQFRPERAVAPIVASKPAAQESGKPLAVFLTPNAERSRELLREAGIATFSQPEACADALRALLNWREPVAREEVLSDPEMTQLLLTFAGVEKLDAAQSQALFRVLGIPQAQEWLFGPDPLDWAAEALTAISYPCALKVVSADVPHKTEAGGVQLNIGNATALILAATQMSQTVERNVPGARVSGYQVQPMLSGLAEALVGFTRDPAVGPIVSVAAGGVLAELYQDVSIRPAPVDRRQALQMIDEVRAFEQVRGYRNMPLGDIDALADTIVRVSRLASSTASVVAEAEINPVLVLGKGSGVRAIDGLVRLEPMV